MGGELIENQLHFKQETVHQIHHENLWNRMICTRLVTHSLTGDQKEDSHTLWTLHPDSLDQPTLSQLHCYWLWVMGVSVWSWNKMSKHEQKTKSSLRPKKFCFQSQGSKRWWSLWWKGCDPQRICAWLKNSEHWIAQTGSRKVTKVDFESEAAILKEMQLVHFLMQ